jgi:bifunctional DNA-binding transcriptional regulator/antitoxin component of YhaV-PrlF toxin-antitoxin module
LSRGKGLSQLKPGNVGPGATLKPSSQRTGDNEMDLRRVIKIKGSYYVNIPLEICDALEIKPGDRLKIGYLAGSGIFITQLKGADKIPISSKSVEEIQKAADFIYFQLARKLKLLEENSISNYHTAMIKEISRLGIFELQRKVDRLEKRSVEVNKVKGQLVLIRQHKKSTG